MIGSNKENLLDRIKHTKKSDVVETIALRVSNAHGTYNAYVRSAQSNKIEGPLLVMCDCVAKSVERDTQGCMHLTPAQRQAQAGEASEYPPRKRKHVQ